MTSDHIEVPPRDEVVGDGLLAISDACAFLGGVSRAFLYSEMERGHLPFVKIGRRRMVPRKGLVSYASTRLSGDVET